MSSSSGSKKSTSGAGSASVVSRKVTGKQYGSKVLAVVHSMKQKNDLCDVLLKAGEIQIAAHREILAGSSQYFREMLLTKYKGPSNVEIPIDNIDPTILEQVIDFMYTSEIVLTNENVEAVLEAAKLYEMEEIIKGCNDFLEENRSS